MSYRITTETQINQKENPDWDGLTKSMTVSKEDEYEMKYKMKKCGMTYALRLLIHHSTPP
jgi:hypothetical protein